MTTFYGKETVRAAFDHHAVPQISYGVEFPEACARHIEDMFSASRVYLIFSKSLSANTDVVDRLQKTLGSKVVGIRVGMKPHTYWSEILEILHDMRPLNVDAIVTVGAGSLTDAAKILAFALANNVRSEKDLSSLSANASPARVDMRQPTVPVISIPTSLSGGEYSSIAGGTKDATKVKFLFSPPEKNPALVILDPGITATTPERVWLSSGVRAIDHCVESYCSLMGNEKADAESRITLEKLIPALLKCKRNPKDLATRFDCQMGALGAMAALGLKAPMGGSHAIGHQLGPLGVGHGETSCIMLPAVCRYNKVNSANGQKQSKLAEILMNNTEVSALMRGRNGDLADILDAVIRELGMPRTLKAVGISRNVLNVLATNTLTDDCAKTNPIPLTEIAQVLEILEMVVE